MEGPLLAPPAARPAAHRRPLRRLFAAGAAVSLAVAGAHRSRAPHPKPELRGDGAASSSASDDVVKSSELNVFSRAHASIDADGDARFLRDYFGLNVTANETAVEDDASAPRFGAACAKRRRLAALTARDALGLSRAPFAIDLFESAVAPEGSRPVSAWVGYWNALHDGFAAGGGTAFKDGALGAGEKVQQNRTAAWDAFLFNALTFYSPDLTPFVRRLRGGGVPMFAASYAAPRAGADDDDATLYSVVAVVPGTGHAVEVVSEHVDGAELAPSDAPKAPFADAWPDDACPSALKLAASVETMRSAWKTSGGAMANARGLPDLLLVKASFPGSVDALGAFVHEVAGDADVSVRARVGGAGRDACRWAGVALGNDVAELRVVEPPAAARVGAWSARDYAAYVNAVHAKWTGDGEGWDRWLFSHFGVRVDTSTALDALVAPLRARNVSWAARVGARDDDVLWTGGVSGQGFAFRGEFDYSEIAESAAVSMDYCATSTMNSTKAGPGLP